EKCRGLLHPRPQVRTKTRFRLDGRQQPEIRHQPGTRRRAPRRLRPPRRYLDSRTRGAKLSTRKPKVVNSRRVRRTPRTLLNYVGTPAVHVGTDGFVRPAMAKPSVSSAGILRAVKRAPSPLL